MSQKQIIVLVALAVADFCVLALGAAILLMNRSQASPLAGPAVAVAVIATTGTPLPQANATATPLPPTPSPTETHWPTWTPRPTRTSFPTNTPTVTPTPTNTPTATSRSTSTPRSPTASAPGGGAPGGGAPAAGPGNRIGCGTPNGQPTNGKLDVAWHIIAWRTSPSDQNRAIGTMEIIPSGGGDCYKYSAFGRTFNYEPIEFEMNKCGSQTVELTVTSADGQTWKRAFILAADDPGFNCK